MCIVEACFLRHSEWLVCSSDVVQKSLELCGVKIVMKFKRSGLRLSFQVTFASARYYFRVIRFRLSTFFVLAREPIPLTLTLTRLPVGAYDPARHVIHIPDLHM